VSMVQYVAIDYFPLHWGAKQIMLGQSPYGAAATAALAQIWPAQFNLAGMAYPLPIVLVIVPLTILPYSLAAAIWILASLSLICLDPLPQRWPFHRLFPLLYFPLAGGLVAGQATAFWVGLIVLLFHAMERRWLWVIGLCIALLPAKPQTGLFFALYGVVWAWYCERRIWWWVLGWSSILWGGATILQPGWISAWLQQLLLYQQIVQPQSIIVVALPLLVTCWHLGWPARITILHVILTPVSDYYVLAPLVICWGFLGGPLALFGTIISWIWWLLDTPNDLLIFWLVCGLPLLICSSWHWRQSHQLRKTVQPEP
jgi:hypothetical protein